MVGCIGLAGCDCHMTVLSCSRVLITTDIWARGIDVQQVSLVINYDLPNNRELYIHRWVWAKGGWSREGKIKNWVGLCPRMWFIRSVWTLSPVLPELVGLAGMVGGVWPSTLWRMMTFVYWGTLNSITAHRLMRCPWTVSFIEPITLCSFPSCV